MLPKSSVLLGCGRQMHPEAQPRIDFTGCRPRLCLYALLPVTCQDVGCYVNVRDRSTSSPSGKVLCVLMCSFKAGSCDAKTRLWVPPKPVSLHHPQGEAGGFPPELHAACCPTRFPLCPWGSQLALLQLQECKGPPRIDHQVSE